MPRRRRRRRQGGAARATKESIALCTAAHKAENAQRSAELLADYGHASLHYGNLVTYLRMLGIAPPSS